MSKRFDNHRHYPARSDKLFLFGMDPGSHSTASLGRDDGRFPDLLEQIDHCLRPIIEGQGFQSALKVNRRLDNHIKSDTSLSITKVVMEPVGISLTIIMDLGGVVWKHMLESIYIQVITTSVL